MSNEKDGQVRVAVVGSGLAGLVVAYLLHNDPKHRYSVVVLESGSEPALDAASVVVEGPAKQEHPVAIDVPMRAFTDGYYSCLMAMYDYLGIHYHWQKFRFVFLQDDHAQPGPGWSRDPRPYFIHASDNHEIPPPRPVNTPLVTYLFELALVVVCYVWFAICCTLVPVSKQPETFEAYLRKIHMPRRFVEWFLLPLLSAVATCSHHEVLNFPSSDIVGYRRKIAGRKQYVVSGGIKIVQKALIQGLDIRQNVRVAHIEQNTSGLEVIAETIDKCGQHLEVIQQYDHVITAVPPNVVAKVFQPARKQLGRIPIRHVETIVHTVQIDNRCSNIAAGVDQVLLKTTRESGGWTEATHIQQGGIGVTSCPKQDTAIHSVRSRSVFTRTLRTPQSRQVVESIFVDRDPWNLNTEEPKAWRNGDHGVWMVGAWCWDGMVLLEGAVVSAMRVAKAFGVGIPWEQSVKGSGNLR